MRNRIGDESTHRRRAPPPGRYSLLGAALIASVVACTAKSAEAQLTPDQVQQVATGARIVGSRLGAGYAQIISIASTPDIVAANYLVTDDNQEARFSVVRVPYESKLFDLTPDDRLYWRVAAGYMGVKLDNAITVSLPQGTGSANGQWTAYSGTAGVGAKFRLPHGFSVEPAVDAGLARLTNSAQYLGTAQLVQPELDRVLLNWTTDAWIVTPSVAVAWTHIDDTRELLLLGHVAYSRVGSFDGTLSQQFHESASVLSMKAEYGIPTTQMVFGHALRWSFDAGYAGFFGANRDALGFTSVANIGGSVGFRFGKTSDPRYLRLQAVYLFGPHLRGWGIGIGLPW